MKKKALLSSALTILLCLSLIAGSTFALFTDTAKTNVAVTSGKVNVVATIENVQLGTTLSNDNVPETSYEVVNGNELVLTGMVPGDYLTFQLHVQNNSDITVLYRTLLKVASDNGLWQGLEVEISEQHYEGLTKVSSWTSLAPETHPDVVNVKISLPRDAGNAYQGKTCSISYTVEAVQGNATMNDPDANVIEIYTVNDLLAFSANVANEADGQNHYAGKTVLLMNDLDLAGSGFNGIGEGHYGSHAGRTFNGTFDGQNFTIYNMNIDCDTNGTAAAGFFSTLGGNAVVKNLKFENANVKSTFNAGVVVGYAHGNGITIENCVVNNSDVSSVPEIFNGGWDNGNNVGGIVGYAANVTVKNCSVANTDISAYRKIGGIAGSISGTVEACDVANVNIVVNDVHNYKNYTTIEQHVVGSVIGSNNGCTVSGNTVSYDTVSAATMVTNA